MKNVNWDEFVKGFKYFGTKRMGQFMADGTALELLREAPEEVKRETYLKCRKVEIDWPGDIPVDTSGIAENQNIIGNDDGKDETQVNPKDPDERFVCNRFPNLSIIVGREMVRFDQGELITDDPAVINAVCEHRYFGIHIFADNPKLRLRR